MTPIPFPFGFGEADVPVIGFPDTVTLVAFTFGQSQAGIAVIIVANAVEPVPQLQLRGFAALERTFSMDPVAWACLPLDVAK